MTVLEVVGLRVAFGDKVVLDDVHLKVGPGRMVAIVGPNGAGKSTLLNACLGLVPTVSGEVRFFGQPREGVLSRIAYIPQRESIDWEFPVSAIDVVCMGLYREVGWLRRIRGSHRERAREALDQVGMAEYEQRQIGQLSGGQQQRVFLARALAQNADCLLMDEPFSGVDARTETAIVDLLHDLRSRGSTVIAVHHELGTVERYFDDVILLNRTVTAAGPVAEVFIEDELARTYGGRLVFLKAGL